MLTTKHMSLTTAIHCCHHHYHHHNVDTSERYHRNSLYIPNRALTLPPRPKRIILIRHGQSQGNVDENAYTRTPDPKIGLTDAGVAEAEECGERIRKLIESDGVDDWQAYFYVSPYKRTLDTLRGLGKAFHPSRIAGVREEPRLREQDFGNFQNREKMRLEKALRIPIWAVFSIGFLMENPQLMFMTELQDSEKPLGMILRLGRFQPPGKRNPNMNLVIVSHGLTLRVFLMRWYKWTVEQFEGLNNLGNGGMIVMQIGEGGRYSLVVHHNQDELKEFGLTDAMLTDQEWQKYAKPYELNYDSFTTGPSFFTHFNRELKEQ